MWYLHGIGAAKETRIVCMLMTCFERFQAPNICWDSSWKGGDEMR